MLSTDNRADYPKWEKTHTKYGINNITSVIAVDYESDFEKNYNITGLPRYFIIDKNGLIVNLYAPVTGNGLKELIEETINKK